MAIFPRPVAPGSAFADLRDMFSRERPHRWVFLAASVGLTCLLLWGFMLDSRIPEKPREIFYVESWMADRKDSDIIRQQIKDLTEYDAALAKKQREFQKVADNLGIDWRKDEARNSEQRKAIEAVIQKRLRDKLAAAEAREAMDKRATPPPPPAAIAAH